MWNECKNTNEIAFVLCFSCDNSFPEKQTEAFVVWVNVTIHAGTGMSQACHANRTRPHPSRPRTTTRATNFWQFLISANTARLGFHANLFCTKSFLHFEKTWGEATERRRIVPTSPQTAWIEKHFSASKLVFVLVGSLKPNYFWTSASIPELWTNETLKRRQMKLIQFQQNTKRGLGSVYLQHTVRVVDRGCWVCGATGSFSHYTPFTEQQSTH